MYSAVFEKLLEAKSLQGASALPLNFAYRLSENAVLALIEAAPEMFPNKLLLPGSRRSRGSYKMIDRSILSHTLCKSRAASQITPLSFYLEAVKNTSTFDTEALVAIKQQSLQGHSIIFAIWHQESLLHLLCPFDMETKILVDAAPEADSYAHLVEAFGFSLLRGSPLQLFLKAKRVLSIPGSAVALAVDGPFGPAGLAKSGAVLLARLTQAILVPLHCQAQQICYDTTWDRRIYPLLHNHLVYVVGHPVPTEGTVEEATALLTIRLHILGTPGFAPLAGQVLDKLEKLYKCKFCH